SRRLLGHVSHRTRLPVPLMSKGSEDACTSSGIATFLLTAFHGTASPAPSAAPARHWLAQPWRRRGPQSGASAGPAKPPDAQFIILCSASNLAGRGVSPRHGRAHRLQRRKPLRGLVVPIATTYDLLQTARN